MAAMGDRRARDRSVGALIGLVAATLTITGALTAQAQSPKPMPPAANDCFAIGSVQGDGYLRTDGDTYAGRRDGRPGRAVLAQADGAVESLPDPGQRRPPAHGRRPRRERSKYPRPRCRMDGVRVADRAGSDLTRPRVPDHDARQRHAARLRARRRLATDAVRGLQPVPRGRAGRDRATVHRHQSRRHRVRVRRHPPPHHRQPARRRPRDPRRAVRPLRDHRGARPRRATTTAPTAAST